MKQLHQWIAAGLLCAGSAVADINVRISVKAVLNPATGLRQSGVDEATFSITVSGMNALLADLGRGYRIQWDGTFTDVGGLGQTNSGPSAYYAIDFQSNLAQKEAMENEAMGDPATFAWEDDAINIYLTQYGGANWSNCSFPGDDHIITINGLTNHYGDAKLVLHEIGHYFDLRHTFIGEQNLNADFSACTNQCACAVNLGGGEDLIEDTVLDQRCWTTQDDVAQGNFGMNYAALNANQTLAVDRIWRNVMSYHNNDHNDIDILTPDQLDRWTDTANGVRAHVVSGRTWFVDENSTCLIPLGTSECSLFVGGPWTTVAEGILVAADEDIVLIRGGTYEEGLTINTPVELRASRGNAVLR